MANIAWSQISATTNGRKWTVRMFGKAEGISGVTRDGTDADPLTARDKAKAAVVKEIERRLKKKRGN